MSEKKVTKKENLTELRGLAEVANRQDLIEFCDKELNLLAKRAANKTLTKAQKENLELVEVVFETLSNSDKAVTATELVSMNPRFEGFSQQKMAALLKKLVDSNRVVKVTEKRKSYFSVKED